MLKQVFVANPNKPHCIIEALLENRRELLKLLHNLPTSKGTVVHECLIFHIEPLGQLGNLDSNWPAHHNVEEWWNYCKIVAFPPVYRWWWTWWGERPDNSANPEAGMIISAEPYSYRSNGTMSFWRASAPVNHTTRRPKIMYIALHAYSHQGLLYFWRVLLLVSGAVADDCPFWRICSWFRETRINGCIYREKRAAEIELTREWVFFEKKETRCNQCKFVMCCVLSADSEYV